MKRSRYIQISLEQEGAEPATFKFIKPNLVQILDEEAERGKFTDTLERIRFNYNAIFSRLLEVKGFTLDGENISIGDVKDLKLPSEILDAIVLGYSAALLPAKREPEKENFTEG